MPRAALAAPSGLSIFHNTADSLGNATPQPGKTARTKRLLSVAIAGTMKLRRNTLSMVVEEGHWLSVEATTCRG